MKLTTLTVMAIAATGLGACATTLQSLPATQIASKAVRAPDGFTGITQTQLCENIKKDKAAITRGVSHLEPRDV